MYHYNVGHSLSGCSASVNQNGYNCLEAIDGITNVKNNGWAYDGYSPAWAVFELREKRKMNTLVLSSGQQRGDHRLIIFRVTLKVDEQWIDLAGLKVKEDPNAHVGHDGTITLVLSMSFYPHFIQILSRFCLDFILILS